MSSERWEARVGNPRRVIRDITDECERSILVHYLLIYNVSPDYLERRGQYRDAHLRLAWEANARGELLLGGALEDPTDSAVLLFQGDSPEVASRFAASDPYVLNGLVEKWQVRPWRTVVGSSAATPVRPAGA